ncbi:hypothetical protein [Amycolatopsis sp. cmx-4-83]|uniref:hypothetical protein n=1 Tax=Amycolatopsis sp. cmx-4-83 TaxID=2790940 RepID=UPI00397D0420
MTVSWWALGVSVFSLTVAVMSLGWNIYSFRRTGPVVQVELHLVSGSANQKKKPRVLQEWQYVGVRFGMHQVKFIQLEMAVYNKGRSPVDLVEAMFGVKGPAVDVAMSSAKMNKRIPLRLEHGSKAVFKMDIVDILEDIEKDELTKLEYFVGQVELGNGDSVFSKRLPYDSWLDSLARAKESVAELRVDEPD